MTADNTGIKPSTTDTINIDVTYLAFGYINIMIHVT
jgi:hypothetical protein